MAAQLAAMYTRTLSMSAVHPSPAKPSNWPKPSALNSLKTRAMASWAWPLAPSTLSPPTNNRLSSPTPSPASTLLSSPPTWRRASRVVTTLATLIRASTPVTLPTPPSTTRKVSGGSHPAATPSALDPLSPRASPPLPTLELLSFSFPTTSSPHITAKSLDPPTAKPTVDTFSTAPPPFPISLSRSRGMRPSSRVVTWTTHRLRRVEAVSVVSRAMMASGSPSLVTSSSSRSLSSLMMRLEDLSWGSRPRLCEWYSLNYWDHGRG